MMLHQNTVGDTFETQEVDLWHMIEMAQELDVTPLGAQGAVVWDPFVAPGGRSQRYITENAHTPGQFGETPNYDDETAESMRNSTVDVIIANPPFSSKVAVLEKLVFDWKKPFVLLLPTATLQRKFMQRFLSVGEWTIHIPDRFLRFHVGGVPCPSPPFPSAFYAWKPAQFPSVRILYLKNHPEE